MNHDYYQPTPELRYCWVQRTHIDPYDGPFTSPTLVLQQRWQAPGEDAQWRDVPTVNEIPEVVRVLDSANASHER